MCSVPFYRLYFVDTFVVRSVCIVSLCTVPLAPVGSTSYGLAVEIESRSESTVDIAIELPERTACRGGHIVQLDMFATSGQRRFVYIDRFKYEREAYTVKGIWYQVDVYVVARIQCWATADDPEPAVETLGGFVSTGAVPTQCECLCYSSMAYVIYESRFVDVHTICVRYASKLLK